MKKTIEQVLLTSTEGVAKMESISHPQPPTPTPLLDEVVETIAKTRPWRKKEIKQAILEYNASLVAEVERLKNELRIEKGVTASHIWNKNHYIAKLSTAEQTIASLTNQLAEAKRENFQQMYEDLLLKCEKEYERGVRDCLDLALKINDGHEWPVSRAISNLINKK